MESPGYYLSANKNGCLRQHEEDEISDWLGSDYHAIIDSALRGCICFFDDEWITNPRYNEVIMKLQMLGRTDMSPIEASLNESFDLFRFLLMSPRPLCVAVPVVRLIRKLKKSQLSLVMLDMLRHSSNGTADSSQEIVAAILEKTSSWPMIQPVLEAYPDGIVPSQIPLNILPHVLSNDCLKIDTQYRLLKTLGYHSFVQ
mmetsp:Transcript_12170/g.21677  ORF Transcript_12170/g.21677 Transcript_12170/m.21677 type:complete len:200 (-) Transcript_12170:26-625(-)